MSAGPRRKYVHPSVNEGPLGRGKRTCVQFSRVDGGYVKNEICRGTSKDRRGRDERHREIKRHRLQTLTNAKQNLIDSSATSPDYRYITHLLDSLPQYAELRCAQFFESLRRRMRICSSCRLGLDNRCAIRCVGSLPLPPGSPSDVSFCS